MNNSPSGARRKPTQNFTNAAAKSGRKVREKMSTLWFRLGRGMDWGFFGMVILLSAVGLVMLYSASYPMSFYESGDGYALFRKQFGFFIAGVVVMLLASIFNYEKFNKPWIARTLLIVQYGALVAVLVIGLIKGAETKRWLGVGGFTIQASEITKLALIIFMAYFCNKFYARNAQIIIVSMFLVGTCSVLLYLEPHYSGIVIVTILVGIMMFLGGVDIKYFVILFIVGGLAIFIIINFFPDFLGYAMRKLKGLGQALTANYYTDKELYDFTLQTRNSMFAIGSGGLTGLGFGESLQKYLFLPEPQNDFIFAIVCEELGFVGAVLILALFALLIYQGMKIAQQARSRFGRLLGAGIILHIALQVVLNILVITDWLPNTGISLPFFSSGGSSYIMIMAEMGIILSISRTANLEKL